MIILLMGLALLVSNVALLAYSDLIGRGVSVADISVEGLTIREAERKVAANFIERKARPLVMIQYGDKTWEVPWDATEGIVDPLRLVGKAYAVGRTGNLLLRLQDQLVATQVGISIHLGLKADMEKLKSIVETAARSVDKDYLDATIVESPTGLTVSADRSGLKTDITATMQKIVQEISSGSATFVPMVVAEIPATIRAKDLQEIDSLLAAFSTTFNSADANRERNIQLAAGALSSVLVDSGAVLSFNEKVGLRLPERGYRQAPTLTSTGMVMDWGGGVCQVSSTLYNAALLADFGVVERSSHYQPPAYVPLGQDATVADGQIDLKLKNTRRYPVYIRSFFDEGRLEFRVYGKMEGNAPTVRIESVGKTVHVPQTIMKQDSTLPLGVEVVESEGSNGFVVTIQRIKMQGSSEVSREIISTDEYQATNRIVRLGTLVPTGQVRK